MPKSRSRPRAAAKAAAQRCLREGLPRSWQPPPAAVQTPEDTAWTAARKAASDVRSHPADWPAFEAAPWQVWLTAHAAGESLESLARLGRQWFWMRDEIYPDEWITEPMTVGELVAGAVPDAIVPDVSTEQAIARLARDGVLLWDQASQTATAGPRTRAAERAEDAAHLEAFGHY
jgi:hypothetical protein